MDIEATSIKVNWTKPTNDGGSPITAYRVLILRGNTEIENRNITDLTAMQLDIGGLTKSTNYSIKLFARNYVFEGNAAERKIQTKYEGMKICTKNALRVHKNCIQSVYLFNYSFIFINTSDQHKAYNKSVRPPTKYCTLCEARNVVIDLHVYCCSHPSSSLYKVSFFKSGIKQKPVIKTSC